VRADAVLYTCSAFGPAIEAFAASTTIPVLKPNEAMFRKALSSGQRIGMLATFAPSVSSMEEEFQELARTQQRNATIVSILVEDAMTALKRGDAAEHNRLLAEASTKLTGYDAIMLAHFSTSRAYDSVAAAVRCPVLTSPGAAVDELRRRCQSA
jgi:Asp/Glu/hydantoin racemase